MVRPRRSAAPIRFSLELNAWPTPVAAAVYAALAVVIAAAVFLALPAGRTTPVRDMSLIADPGGIASVRIRGATGEELRAAAEIVQRGLIHTFPRIGFRFERSGEVRYATRVEAPGRLEVQLGVEITDGQRSMPQACEFAIDVAPRGGQPQRLLEEWLEPPLGEWQMRSVRLDDFAGRDVELVFSARVPGPSQDGNRAAAIFGSPALRYDYPLAHRTFRNVVFIVVDTLRYDYLGATGCATVRTPHIDRLFAEHGVAFANYRSAAPWTIASFSAMLTGAYPCFSGEVDDAEYLLMRRRADTVTLAEIFRANGYATMAVSTNDIMDHYRRFDIGFDTYRYQQFTKAADAAWHVRGFIEEHRRSPFFVMAHFNDPHTPYGDRGGHPIHGWLRLPGVEPFVHLYYPLGMAGQTSAIRSYAFTDEEKGQIVRMYEDDIALADDGVGEIMDCLKANGLDKNTLIVFTSDHGEEFWDHGSFEHGHTMYDELVHCPLVFSHPSLTGATTDAPIAGVDLAPTILDLAGIDRSPYARQFQGQSYARFLRGHDDAPPSARYVLSATAVRDNRLRYPVDRRMAEWLWERAEVPEGGTADIDRKIQASMCLVHYPTMEEMKSVVVDNGEDERFKYVLDGYTFDEALFDLLADPKEHDNLLAHPAGELVGRDEILLLCRRALLAILTATGETVQLGSSVAIIDARPGDSVRHNPYMN